MGQLRALFGKNWLLYKRNLCGNVMELIFPVFFVMFIMLVKYLDPPTQFS